MGKLPAGYLLLGAAGAIAVAAGAVFSHRALRRDPAPAPSAPVSGGDAARDAHAPAAARQAATTPSRAASASTASHADPGGADAGASPAGADPRDPTPAASLSGAPAAGLIDPLVERLN